MLQAEAEPAAPRGVRSIVDDVASFSSGLAQTDAGSDVAKNAARPTGDADAVDDDDELVAMAAMNSAAQLEEWLGETSASTAWLGEEESKLREELRKFEAVSAKEDAECERLEAEMDEAAAHVFELRAHVMAQARAGVAARSMLDSAHVCTSQQIAQILETIERILRADSALQNGERSRIMARLRTAADEWLREAAELSTQLAGLQPKRDKADHGAPGATIAGGAAADDMAVSKALQAAAKARGALIDRVNASRLELSATKVRLAHVAAATEKEGNAAAAALEMQLAQLRELQASEEHASDQRDAALAEISEIIGCARSAESALDALRSHYENPPADDEEDADADGDTPASSSRVPSPAPAVAVPPYVAARRAQQLAAVSNLLQEVASSGVPGGDSGAEAPSPSRAHPSGAASSIAGVLGAARSNNADEGETATSHTSALGSLGYDTTLRLAVRRVSMRRESCTGRWAQLAKTAASQQQSERSVAAKSSSELTAIRQAERKLHQLEVQLHTCERAIEQSEAARRRVEARLAKELYFQRLFKQGISDHGAGDKGKRPELRGERERAIVKMNELRCKAVNEAAKLSQELRVALKTREEEHSARVRAQMQGTVRRLIHAQHDGVVPPAAARPPPPKPIAEAEAAPPPATEAAKPAGLRRPSMVKQRTVSAKELRRPSMMTRRGSTNPRLLEALEEDPSEMPVLLGLAKELHNKTQQAEKDTPRSLSAAAQATACVEILKSLAVHEPGM